VAKLLGLGYPGGPEIERRARAGNASRVDFPRSMLDSGDHNFSFSGLKTAVRYTVAKLPRPLASGTVDDLCASFQAAVVEVLVRKTIAAARATGVPLITLSGGVSCNGELRRQLQSACEEAGFQLRPCAPALATDNAAMIAFVAGLRLASGFRSALSEEIDPNLRLT